MFLLFKSRQLFCFYLHGTVNKNLGGSTGDSQEVKSSGHLVLHVSWR